MTNHPHPTLEALLRVVALKFTAQQISIEDLEPQLVVLAALARDYIRGKAILDLQRCDARDPRLSPGPPGAIISEGDGPDPEVGSAPQQEGGAPSI